MRGILISPDASERDQFVAAARANPLDLILSRVLDAYPDEETLSRMIRAWAPEAIFLSMHDPTIADALSRQITRECGSIQQIALHTSQDLDIFRLAMNLRMRELLTPPFDTVEFVAMLERRAQELAANPVKIGTTDKFFAFLPAKSGVGTSTIAANLTWALSKLPDTRVLLADFDLYSGVSGFLFNVDHEYLLADAVKHKAELDYDTWHRLVKKVGNIDLLLSGAPRLPDQIQSRQFTGLMEFARRNYSVVNADLPDSLDDITLTVLREANRIFLTTTAELPALRLAKLKALALRKLDLESKTVLLVNRVSKRAELTMEQIEETVGVPVFASFACEYEDVMRATRDGRPSPKLANSFAQFAAKVLDQKAVALKRTRFIERFAVVPLRYGFR